MFCEENLSHDVVGFGIGGILGEGVLDHLVGKVDPEFLQVVCCCTDECRKLVGINAEGDFVFGLRFGILFPVAVAFRQEFMQANGVRFHFSCVCQRQNSQALIGEDRPVEAFVFTLGQGTKFFCGNECGLVVAGKEGACCQE